MDPVDPADGAPEAPARPVTAGGPWAWLALAVILVLLAVTVAFTVTGGSNGSSNAAEAAACTPAVVEPLDPSSVVRLLPNAAAPTYDSDPPTSGAFQVGAQSPPVSTVELTPSVQVGLLAQGTVLFQYRDLDASALAQLQTLAGDGVVVAPNATLTSPVVATAWRKKQTCTAVDINALRQFATLNADQGPSAGVNGTTSTTAP